MSIHRRAAEILGRLVHIVEHPELIPTIGKQIDREVMRDLLFIKKTLLITPSTILDVGASVGNWSYAAKYVYPSASVIAFEPLPDVHAGLRIRFRNHHNFKALNIALGRTNDRCVFYRNQFSFSSSYQQMTHDLKKLFPHASETNEILVDRRRLDALPDIVLVPPVFLKVDSQGSEMDVLDGCGELLSHMACVQVEMNFVSLYEGQPSPEVVVRYMAQHGFDRFLQWHPYFQDGRLVTCDMLFFRGGEAKL